MAFPGLRRISCPSYTKEARFAGRNCGADYSPQDLVLAGVEIHKLNTLNRLLKKCFLVILSEAKNLSLFFFLYLSRREILRFAQNDRESKVFSSL